MFNGLVTAIKIFPQLGSTSFFVGKISLQMVEIGNYSFAFLFGVWGQGEVTRTVVSECVKIY